MLRFDRSGSRGNSNSRSPYIIVYVLGSLYLPLSHELVMSGRGTGAEKKGDFAVGILLGGVSVAWAACAKSGESAQ